MGGLRGGGEGRGIGGGKGGGAGSQDLASRRELGLTPWIQGVGNDGSWRDIASIVNLPLCGPLASRWLTSHHS